MVSLLLCAGALGMATLVEDAELTRHVVEAVKATLAETVEATGVKPDEVAATYVELGEGKGPFKMGQYRGDEPFYPASVVKLFYLAYAHERMERGEIRRTDEVDRCLRDMIVDSSNEATQAVVDLVTDTTGGPELAPTALAKWVERRNVVNRWYAARGYEGINVNQKTYGEGPYGRERQFLGPNFENRNRLSSNATARLMVEIAMRQIVTPERCGQMLELLHRAIPADSKEADSQSKDFTGAVLPSGSALYSKAGWTSTVRHDVAFVKLPDGRMRVIAICTKAHSGTPVIIKGLARRLLGLPASIEPDPGQ